MREKDWCALVTLAPEHDLGFKVTRHLAKERVVVSAGHCNPTLEQLRGAVDAGVTMFTHLGNGCPLQMHRHDNIIQRVLSLADRLWISVIADGVHVPYYVLGNFLRCVPATRAIVITDATAAAGCGPGRFKLGGRDVEVGDDLAAWGLGKSHLVGSAMTMPVVVQNLRKHLRLSDEAIERLVSGNPRALLAGG